MLAKSTRLQSGLTGFKLLLDSAQKQAAQPLSLICKMHVRQPIPKRLKGEEM